MTVIQIMAVALLLISMALLTALSLVMAVVMTVISPPSLKAIF